MFNPNLNLGGTLCFAKTGLIAGTNFSYTTTVATDYIIDGKFGVKFATKTNQALPATDATTGVAFVTLADDEGAALVFGINAAGAIQVAQGDSKKLDPTGSEFLIAPPFPSLPNDFCTIGYAILQNESGSAFTTGVTDWADIVTTFVNVAMLPDRPQES